MFSKGQSVLNASLPFRRPFQICGESGGADIGIEARDVGGLVERVDDRADRVVVPVALEKDVEQRNEIFDERLVVLLSALVEHETQNWEEVGRVDHLLDVGDLVRVRLVVGVEELDGLGCEGEARVDDVRVLAVLRGRSSRLTRSAQRRRTP